MLQNRIRLFILWDCKIISICISSRFSKHYQHYQFYSMQKLPAVTVKTAIKKKSCQLINQKASQDKGDTKSFSRTHPS